jgi:hypothetical protein
MKHPVEQALQGLRRAGLRPSDRQVEDIRNAGPEAVPALLALASDTTLLVGPEPAAFAPLHALRLLAEQPEIDAATIEHLFVALPLPDPEPGAQAAFVWRQDLPQILGRGGKVASDMAAAILRNTAAAPDQRAAAIETLVYATAVDDGLRADAVVLLDECLKAESDPYVGAYLVDGLADLGAAEAYADVMAAYRRGVVDKTIVSAADARRRLLSRVPSAGLICVSHTLDERYVQHGPFTEEQRRAMVDQYLGRR